MLRPHLIICLTIVHYFEQWYVEAATTIKYLPPPKLPRWHEWAETITNNHLTNMTGEILKDIKMKLEQAKTIQSKYMYSMTYELGTIAASIQDYFTHMLEIYRTYANLDNFINYTHTMDEVLNAYHIVQGDYNQIRTERDLFYQVLENHEEVRRQKLKKIHQFIQPGNPNADDVLKRLEKGERIDRRLFNGSGRLDTPNVQDLFPRRRTMKAEGLPRLVTRKPTAKRKWEHRPKWFGEETRLDD